MPNQRPTLLVLAAGIGSRYGGLKQIDPVGTAGETIMDYSIFDALRAGFGKVVFVIRREIEAAFKNFIAGRFENRIDVQYAFQELDDLPAGFRVPSARKKPWGTGHAILVAGDAVREPFAVINADDFYGAASFRLIHDHLRSGADDHAMVGFVLRNTLSEFGSVARGVCQIDDAGFLRGVTELTKIERDDPGAKFTDESGRVHRLSGDEIVSLNMWGFTPSLFARLREQFIDFLRKHGMEEKSEFYIPTVVNALVNSGRSRLRVLRTPDRWFGVTYKEDRPRVVDGIRQLLTRGDYPERLWS